MLKEEWKHGQLCSNLNLSKSDKNHKDNQRRNPLPSCGLFFDYECLMIPS